MDNDGRVDLVLGCLRSTNRYLRNTGERFEDASEKIGLNQRIYNTQAVALVDLNGDGVVNAIDLALVRRRLGQRPGPSDNAKTRSMTARLLMVAALPSRPLPACQLGLCDSGT